MVIAGILEVVWSTAMKYSEGFTRWWPSVITLLAMVLSFGLLSIAMRSLPLGTAYAVWTGIGAIGAVLVGILFLGESGDPRRLFCLALIIGGIVGLRFAGG
ncbi:MAG TPA: quaternary ammonium compound efflux SMR transporter SugE [Limnochordia bacterium]